MNKFSPFLCCCFITIIIGFNFLDMYAQSGNASIDFASLKTITPNAPTTASLGCFGEYPVNYVYGLPSINIPLLEFSSGSLMQKINLQYHADGIKVRERASWVGLGWSLFAGGVITSNVNGYPDLNGYFDNVKAIPTLQERIIRLLRGAQYDSLNKGMCWANTIIYGEKIGGLPFINPDVAPDVYNISANGLSGSFVFNSDWEPVLTDATLPIKVVDRCTDVITTYASGTVIKKRNSIVGFSVIDKDGYTYIFGGADPNSICTEATYTWDDFATDLQHGYISAWYLNKILSPDKTDSIEFFYERDVDIEDIQPSFYSSRSYNKNDDYKTFQHILTHTIKLDKIKFKNGQIIFFRSNWQDGEDSKLDSIILYSSDNTNTNGYRPIREIYFDYNFFINKDNTNNLKLSKVRFTGSDNRVVQQYSFGYNSLKLPGRNSCDLDHWGYYNGANNHGTSALDYTGEYGLIPRSTSYISTPSGGYTITEGIGDREPNANFTQACILDTVHYPTGGKSIFKYENHKTGDDVTRGGLRIKQIINYDNNHSLESITQKEYEYSGGYLVGAVPNEYTYSRRYYRDGGNCMPYLSICQKCDYNSSKAMVDEVVFNSNGKGIYQSQSTTAYKQVIERVTDKLGHHLGEAVYKYPEQRDVCRVYSTTGSLNSFFTPYQSYAPIRENPSFIGYYDINDKPVKETEYKYYNSGLNNVVATGLMCERNNFYSEYYRSSITGGCVARIDDFNSNYFFATYYILQLKNQLTKTVEKNYFSTGITTETTDYFYGNTGHPFPVRIEKRNSDGNSITYITKYPMDYLTQPTLTYEQLHELLQNHVISAKINTSKLVNNLLTECDIAEYEGLYPKTIYSLVTNNKITIPSYFNSSPAFYIIPPELTQYMKPKIHFTYDNGKLISQQKEQELKTSYIWGYNNTLPIAEVKNAETNEVAYTSFENSSTNSWAYDSGEIITDVTASKTGRNYFRLWGTPGIFKTIVPGRYRLEYWAKSAVSLYCGGAITDISASSPDPKGWILFMKEINASSNTTLYVMGSTSIDELRLYPIDAQMSTFTYDLLVGMTSQTDPNGLTTYFEYDSLGRLKYIKDNDGNILKEYNYHYKN